MSRRSRRSDVPPDATQLLAAIRTCRLECVRLLAVLTINGETYRQVYAFMAALDDLTGQLTGNREAFWNKRHSIQGLKRAGAQDASVIGAGRRRPSLKGR